MRISTPRFWVFLSVLTLFSLQAEDGNPPFMSTLHHVDTLTSTVPFNGDVNPYGVAVVPVTTGALVANNITVVPIRSGVGLRLGANLGYLKFTDRPTWNPF